MEPLAKPSGIRLADHRDHVVLEAERLLGLRPGESSATPGLPFLVRKYNELTGHDLVARVRSAAWHHDKGKEHPVWQGACREDYKTYRAWRAARGLDPHGVDPSDYRRFSADRGWRHRGKAAGAHLLMSGLRHEFASLSAVRANPRLDLSLAERVAIAAHHGKLGTRHERRWRTDAGGAFAPLWEELFRTWTSSTLGLRSDADALGRRYEVAGVRALLQLADTRASRAETGAPLAHILPFHYDWPHTAYRKVQQLALEHAEDWVTVLRAPTGSGKTDAALLWGQRQVDLGRADRVVVAMPTRFTANALAVSAAGALSDTGLYHSSAWHARYGDVPRGSDAFDLAREAHALARRLATPLTVCTVDHLLLALTGTREDHHATFFFLANSAVVFDEVDFYDPFVQANLVALLDTLRALRVPVLLMSATVPDSARRLYGVETPVRHTLAESSGVRYVHRHPPVERPEDAAEVLDAMLDAGTGIVYANTVERAYRYWTHLRDRAQELGLYLPILLYHSRFTEPDKLRVEEALVGALGRRAWEDRSARGIAVLTQIGEMSINVSAPRMLSDLCPWDRLAQRAGRLARFRDLLPEGDLHVADPHRGGALYPAPYGAFEKGTGWTPGRALVETRERLDGLTADGPLELTPARLVDEVDVLYPEPESFDARTEVNVRALRDMVRNNWMIVPMKDARDDEADVPGEWRSRDIPPQTTLFVLGAGDLPEEGPVRFNSYDEYYRHQLEWGVSCPAYLARRGLQRGMISPIPYTIGEGLRPDEKPGTLLWCVQGYEPPNGRGEGGGLAVLALREHEDEARDAFL